LDEIAPGALVASWFKDAVIGRQAKQTGARGAAADDAGQRGRGDPGPSRHPKPGL